MLVTLIGDVYLLLGLVVLLIPVLITELSRPRDGIWGAVVLLFGWVVLNSNDRLSGTPMIAVICSSLLISRLGWEVVQSRWLQLSEKERSRLFSSERWTTAFQQFASTVLQFVKEFGNVMKVFSWKPQSKTLGKKWVRPEMIEEKASSNGESQREVYPKNASIEDIQEISESSKDPKRSLKDS